MTAAIALEISLDIMCIYCTCMLDYVNTCGNMLYEKHLYRHFILRSCFTIICIVDTNEAEESVSG